MADPGAIREKISLISEQLGVHDFDGFSTDAWPSTTFPALNLAAAAYEVDRPTGLAASLALRSALFEQGRDVSAPEVLADVAGQFHLQPPGDEPAASVTGDYAEGKRRGVRGSPDFFIGDDEFFCPSLDLGHDDDGTLTSRFDADGLRQLIATAAA
jgi:predicted DsbA family dithiol-disulfide isomerase